MLLLVGVSLSRTLMRRRPVGVENHLLQKCELFSQGNPKANCVMENVVVHTNMDTFSSVNWTAILVDCFYT